MKKVLEKIDIRSFLAGTIIGLFVALAVFSALVPSGPEMIRVYNLKRYQNMKTGDVEINRINQ